MRTNEERTRLVRERTAQRRRARALHRRRTLDAACLAACLLLVAGSGALMPELIAPAASVSHASGAASLIGSHASLGYILMGLMAFLLGVCVTVGLYRLRRREERRRREEERDEL